MPLFLLLVAPRLDLDDLGVQHSAPLGCVRARSFSRTRSTDGRRASGPHEVISLNSTTSKSLAANQVIAHPLVLAAAAGASPATSILAASGVGLPPPPSSPYTGGPVHGGTTPVGGGGMPPGTRSRTPPDMAVSTASSRFNPVVEDDDEMPPLHPQQQQQQGSESMRESQVLLGGGAVAAAAATAAGGGGNSTRRYATAESVAMSHQQHQQQSQQSRLLTGESNGGASCDAEESGVSGSARGRLGHLQREDSAAPGTPGSVASGRVGGVFFTDLHRSFGGQGTPGRASGGVGDSQDLRDTLAAEEVGGDGDGDDHEDGRGNSRASRLGLISAVTSRLNPMQSPTMSEDGEEDDEGDDLFAEYAGEALRSAAAAEASSSGGASGSTAEEAATAGGRASTSALTDYTNPVQTPYDSRLPTPLLPSAGAAAELDLAAPMAATSDPESRKSLLLVIQDLYVTDSEPRLSMDPSRPATAAGEPLAQTPATPMPPESPVEGDGGGEVEGGLGTDDTDALAASRAAVAALAARAESQQSQRRSELGEYMTALQELKDESGGRLVELPADWGVMLERLFRQRRAEFETLQGWMGPRRFEDLPINQLPSNHPDPRVEEGLSRIRELDAVLNDKLIAALISHRETFPDQWAEQERKRLEKHTKAVEEALKRERQKRLRAARISRAVTSLDAGPSGLAASPSSVQGSSMSLAAGGQAPSIYSRLFTLKPELTQCCLHHIMITATTSPSETIPWRGEEALVEAVLRRNDDEGAAINPFDLESAATYGSVPEGADGAEGVGGGGVGGTSFADPDDIDLDLDMFLPSTSTSASTCVTPSAAAPMPRPLSARLTEANGGGGAMRPLSAMSYSSSSRPGTSSGPAGGLSPLAAAALHGHPALLAAGAGLRNSGIGGGGGGGGATGLLPERVYDDPRAAARALRAINARLAAFESEHLWDESGALADFKSVTATQPQPQPQQQGRKPPQLGSEASLGPSPSVVGPVPASAAAAGAPPPAAAAAAAGRRTHSPPRSVRSAAGGQAASVSGVSVTAGGHRDYLREERLAKELAMRERDVDTALRSLKTGEVVRLGEVTLKALVEQCRRLQELNEHRRKIEEAEAAARKAQLQRQQLLASRASETGSARGGLEQRQERPQTPPAAAPQRGAVAGSRRLRRREARDRLGQLQLLVEQAGHIVAKITRVITGQ
ncbi:hypothetical protein VOLCADRAFT_99621 [Volvox carteri f. nagariensis]|uniref:Uncharacterized protein n=1 Tax=Volvox carteri f. nagariensis TaxID=3068 RepID=D8UI85_VOLCA|nr:uncharacterized protein VOLCADRAFT_99621 [Volvox carteri f. nagariensis]EFJ40569.1 hypothetical protein VOLCADRAFT_99621 [Volvox carteri f. nagariensis]|eukprot:XP_002958347.1 hypothetical protein VOLCADRAFT_99621 [Volvox carteri f. nagariensis]